jgi:hypothetical protein
MLIPSGSIKQDPREDRPQSLPKELDRQRHALDRAEMLAAVTLRPGQPQEQVQSRHARAEDRRGQAPAHGCCGEGHPGDPDPETLATARYQVKDSLDLAMTRYLIDPHRLMLLGSVKVGSWPIASRCRRPRALPPWQP